MFIKVDLNDFTKKIKDFYTFKKLLKIVGKLIVATGFEKLPKVQ